MEAKDKLPVAPPQGARAAEAEEEIIDFLQIWAAAAWPGGRIEVGPFGLPIDSPQRAIRQIRRWAGLLLAVASHEEEDQAPRAWIQDDEGEALTLVWEGTWTEGRGLSVHLTSEGGRLQCALLWDSGTGCPSRYLAQLGVPSD